MANRTEEHRGLDGLEVAITGRLGSMDREEARKRIADANGVYVEEPGLGTAYLVIGQGGPPLDEEGRPTRKLQRARELEAIGHTLEVVPEVRFLALLGLDRQSDELHRLYTTAQLARILDLPSTVVRSWVRHGLIRPLRVVNRLEFFDFPQVATARTLSGLARAGVTPQRIRRSLEELSGWYPGSERALNQLRALEEDGELLVRTHEGKLAETSGQLRLAFDATDSSQRPASPDLTLHVVREAAPASEAAGLDAHAWFERGVDAEEQGQLEEAVACYRRAVTIAPDLVEACFNLGNVLYGQERHDEAAHYYGRATELEPDYVEAWNNFGIVLSELGRAEEAIAAFRRALVIAPDYADVHYNLGETFAARGDIEAARRHWRAYLNMDPTSMWSIKVRERLRSGLAGGALRPHVPR